MDSPQSSSSTGSVYEFSETDFDSSNSDDDVGLAAPRGYAFEPEWTPEELAERELRRQQLEHVETMDHPVEPPVDDDGHEDRTRIPVDQWCQCQNCQVIPTNMECDCCHDVIMVMTKMEQGDGEIGCITAHPDFDAVCLNNAVLLSIMARLHYAYIERLESRNPTNKCYRFTSYKQFIFWIHGFLGKKVRRVIPSCAVAKIRKKFPSETGEYVGFLEAVVVDQVDED